MSFSAATAHIVDANGQSLDAIRNFKVVDAMGHGMPACSFEPSLEFAMADHAGPQAITIFAGGRLFRVQLTKWGANGLVGYAEGLVVG